MPRLPQPTRESVREELRDVFDEVSAGPGGTGTGPMSVLKNSPELARRAIPLFNYLRNESSLPQHVRELAMLTAARATDWTLSDTPLRPFPCRRLACDCCST